MTLPPWARKVQQSWTWHIVQAAALGAGAGAFTCFATANDFTWACAKTGLIIGGGALFLSAQHSPGSASFKPDGTDNQPVKEAVALQTAGIPVAVVPAK